jgi:hypothetical protein
MYKFLIKEIVTLSCFNIHNIGPNLFWSVGPNFDMKPEYEKSSCFCATPLIYTLDKEET